MRMKSALLRTFVVLLATQRYPSSGSPATEGNGNEETRGTIPYVVDGMDAPEGRFPYVCRLTHRRNTGYLGTGLLFRRKWVVTAAHCADVESGDISSKDLVVRCGFNDLNDTNSVPHFDVIAAHIHPCWTGDHRNGYDIAVIELSGEAAVTVPAYARQRSEFNADQEFAAVGWGRTEERTIPRRLQMADKLKDLSPQICERTFGLQLMNQMICAGLSGQGTCEGDSGGPLLIPNRAGGNLVAGRPEHDLVVGITSFGSSICDARRPGVYTSIGYFWDWILDTVDKKAASPSADCPRDERQKELIAERKRLQGLTIEELLPEAIRAIMADRNLTLEAALGEGLQVESVYFYPDLSGFPLLRGSTLLHWAAANDAEKCAEVLVKFGANVQSRNVGQFTPLHVAAINGSIGVAEYLVQAGAEVTIKDEYGGTPLQRAAGFGHHEVAKMLLANGAKVNTANKDGWMALHYAARYGHLIVAQLLLENGANVNAAEDERWTPLHFSSFRGFSDIVKLLLENGAEVNAVNDFGWTPLHYASRYRYPDIVEALLENGANADSADNQGWTPLHHASRYGQLDTVESLLKNGAKVDDAQNDGWTSLQMASRFGHLEVVELLLTNGAKVDAANDNGWTSLHLTSRYGHLKSTEVLLKHGAEMQIKTVYGNTPLHLASVGGHLDIARVLVNADASRSSTNDSGRTPLQVVCTAENANCTHETRTALGDLLTI